MTRNKVTVSWNWAVKGYFWCWHVPGYGCDCGGPFPNEAAAFKEGIHTREFVRIASGIKEAP